MESLSRRASRVLLAGYLTPDKRNIELFAKLVSCAVIVACVAFSAGFSSAWTMSNTVHGIQAEQCKRTTKVYGEN